MNYGQENPFGLVACNTYRADLCRAIAQGNPGPQHEASAFTAVSPERQFVAATALMGRLPDAFETPEPLSGDIPLPVVGVRRMLVSIGIQTFPPIGAQK